MVNTGDRCNYRTRARPSRLSILKKFAMLVGFAYCLYRPDVCESVTQINFINSAVCIPALSRTIEICNVLNCCNKKDNIRCHGEYINNVLSFYVKGPKLELVLIL